MKLHDSAKVPAKFYWAIVVCLLTISCGTAELPGSTTASDERTASLPRVYGSAPTIASPASSPVLAIAAGPSGALSLLSSGGTTVATTTVHPAAFRPNAAVSWTSASSSRVYYLDGSSEIRYLAPDGTTGPVQTLQLQPNQEAGFAVSADDSRIAVSVFTYSATGDVTPTYEGMRLYVEGLQGSSRHADIFSSSTVAEFPIAWVAGRLVLAVTSPLCCASQPLNPYGAISFHEVNPDTGDRLLSLCGAPHIPVGPIEAFGVMCTEFGAQFFTWDGTELMPPAAIPYPGERLNAASPDGRLVAVAQDDISIWGPAGGSRNLAVSGTVYGWLDAHTIVIRQIGASSLTLVDVQNSATVDVAGTTYLGPFPSPFR